MTPPFLHIGGASAAGVVIILAAIFLLMFILSFAFWRGPQDHKRWSGPWLSAWARASAPRIAIAAIFSVGLFVASSLSGGGDDDASGDTVCSRGLPALTSQPLTDARLAAGVDGLIRLQAAATDGDFELVRVIIFSDAHSVSHDIDATLRPLDSSLATDLCKSIVALELEIAGDMNVATIIDEAGNAARLMDEARIIISDSGDTTSPFDDLGVGVGACADPIGRITDDPVTDQRIENAAEKMRAIADAAARGEPSLIDGLFSGDTHNVTHDIDGPLRVTDAGLAIDLCLNVLELEIHLAGEYDLETVEEVALASADLLLQARSALEINR
ncbi:MAG: hypothetical protein ACE5FA_06200 [Dehalococcoidia bacterium]